MAKKLALTDDLDIDDLFSDAFDPDDGEPMQPSRKGKLVLNSVDAGSLSETLSLNPKGLELTFEEEDYGDTLELRAALTNDSDCLVELTQLMATLRSGEGHLVDQAWDSFDSKFSKTQEIVSEFRFGTRALALAETLDLTVSYGLEFQTVLAASAVEALDVQSKCPQRNPIPLEIERPPVKKGQPEFDLEVGAMFGHDGCNPYLEVVLTLLEHTPSATPHRDVVVALRDAKGKVVAKESDFFDTAGLSAPHSAKFSFDLKLKELRTVRRVDIAAKGECRRVERLGRFAIERASD